MFQAFSTRAYILLMLILPMQQEHCKIVSQAIPIPFCSTNLFQYQDVEEGSGDLRPHCVNLYGNSLEPTKLQST